MEEIGSFVLGFLCAAGIAYGAIEQRMIIKIPLFLFGLSMLIVLFFLIDQEKEEKNNGD